MVPTLFVRCCRNALAIVGCIALLALPAPIRAQDVDAAARLKIAGDLATTLASSALPTVPWSTLLNGELLVRVLVAASSDDSSLTDLRQGVLALGGSVYYNYTSIRALAVMVPASRVMDLARRADVVSISPNRAVSRVASLLQVTTGARDAPPPPRGTLDGSGVGIAVVDSGIGYSHR